MPSNLCCTNSPCALPVFLGNNGPEVALVSYYRITNDLKTQWLKTTSADCHGFYGPRGSLAGGSGSESLAGSGVSAGVAVTSQLERGGSASKLTHLLVGQLQPLVTKASPQGRVTKWQLASPRRERETVP